MPSSFSLSSILGSSKHCPIVKRRRTNQKRAAHFETLESRNLLAGAGVLQGIAYIDDNVPGFSAGDTPKAFARIQLVGPDMIPKYADADASGKYVFTGLQPGVYELTDITFGYTTVAVSTALAGPTVKDLTA